MWWIRALLITLCLLPLCFAVSGWNQTAAWTSVYVMLPLDLFDDNNQLKNKQELRHWMQELKGIHVDGIMVDVWWGLVESQPEEYDWSGYQELFSLVDEVGLKIQAIMSFHQCGGNVGDTCNIPLPLWVLAVGDNNPDIFYTDKDGNRNAEYISLGADNERLFQLRTPLDLYTDYMQSFRDTFASSLGDLIVSVSIGAGPAGEIRYPSYPLDRWQYCGIGEFQCYDKFMLNALSSAAAGAGRPEWGHGGPHNAGSYNSRPWDTGFFGEGKDNWASPYGQFFLGWYSGMLVAHADALMSRASAVFGSSVDLAMKIAGIHWWYNHPSHAAELTAGYYNTREKMGYVPIAEVIARRNGGFCFTCLEMRDSEQDPACDSGPEGLVQETKHAALSSGASYEGENALPRYDEAAYRQIELQASKGGPTHAFTYLRLNNELMSGPNLQRFATFVHNMHAGKHASGGKLSQRVKQ